MRSNLAVKKAGMETTLIISLGRPVDDFESLMSPLKKTVRLAVASKQVARLKETREFIDYLLARNIRVYGLTTGFGDLRSKSITPSETSTLSYNILLSHDAGIGEPMAPEIVKGAMIICAQSLAKGYSGITVEGLNILVDMINEDIIPIVPVSGSLGASGDLAFLARLGRSMQGHQIQVYYKGQKCLAHDALKAAGIPFLKPKAKEGLALTNGTSFMTSMLIHGFWREVMLLEHILLLMGMFLSAVRATDTAFYESLHTVRPHKGQMFIANILSSILKDSPFPDVESVQDDYCMRCLPQILGPLCENLRTVKEVILNEINAVTDNPLVFQDKDISSDVSAHKKFIFKNKTWSVLSGGNFHGEYLANAADRLAMVNAKLAFTMERQITYMLNPARNKGVLPTYLIANEENIGLESGFMITQYTANAVTQKIAYLGNPVSTYNITSANEAEDIVSYGANATQKLLAQLEHLKELTSIYLIVVGQAYGLQRNQLKNLHPNLATEKAFKTIQTHFKNSPFPRQSDDAFGESYATAGTLIDSHALLSESDNLLQTFLSAA